MIHVIMYLVIGVVSIFGFTTAHLIMAERNGYEALKWWTENKGSLDTSVDGNFIVGLLIWPVRLAEFVLQTIPELYDMYERKW